MAAPNTSSVYETVVSTSRQISNSSNRTALLVRVDSTNYPLSVFYWTIFVVGLTGNVLLISINIWRRSSKQLTTQLFMISLAVSDLGLLLGNTWIQAYTSASSNFIFGSFMCKFTKLWAFAASCSSALTLAIIGIDR